MVIFILQSSKGSTRPCKKKKYEVRGRMVGYNTYRRNIRKEEAEKDEGDNALWIDPLTEAVI